MNLYNVLIADDEAFIVDWLSSLLEKQNDLNISIYRAYTPSKALELIERIRTDLLISDIKMPEYSGFDLAKRMQQLWPNSKTILLTAYSDFSYAQQAIQQGIVSYILKSADDQNILSEIQKALLIIEQESNQLAAINNIEKDLTNFETRLNSQIFSLWIKGYYTQQDLNENVDTLGFDAQVSSSFMLLICRPDFLEQLDTRQLKNIMKPFQIQRIIERYLTPHLKHSAYEMQGDLLLGILQPNQTTNKDIAQIISSALEPAQAVCLETLNCKISCLISAMGTSSEIPLFWSYGKSLLNRFSKETDFIFCYDREKKTITLDIEEYLLEELLKSSFYKSMSRSLKNGDRNTFMEQLSRVCTYLSKHSNWYDNCSLQIYFSLVLVLSTILINKN